MKFSYKLTVWECIRCGAGRAFGYLVHRSRFFRTLMLILGGAALLGSILMAAGDGGFRVVPVILMACALLFLCLFVWATLVPVEVIRIYQQCGKRERTVRIEDGSIFVTDQGTTREYLCRDILEFKKQGPLFRIAMTWRMGKFVELYLPARLAGDKEGQESFRSYVNDQRRISGDKLVEQVDGQTDEQSDEQPDGQAATWDEDEGCICQRWSMETITAAMAESHWIGTHIMKWADRRRRLIQNLVPITFLAVMCLFVILNMRHSGMFGGIFVACMIGWMVIRMRPVWTPQALSQQSICDAIKQQDMDFYRESWKLEFTPEGIHRTLPMLENIWAWNEIGYLLESDEFFFFYSPKQILLFYMEKGLMGDWMAQKLFIQDCQAKGISYQIVHPEYARGIRELEEAQNAPAGREAAGKKGFYVVDGGKAPRKQEEGKGSGKAETKNRRGVPDTQEGWRKFWAEKEKGNGNADRLRVAVTVAAVIGIFLLAIFLPEFRGSQGIGGIPVMMDMPQNGEEYVFHPESYKDYKPLADQVTVLQSLGFTIPEDAVEEMNRSMEEMPMARAWIEGYPYTSLLMAVGMPEWDSESWTIKNYPDQAYWFDWEGFDMSMEYVHILNGVNAMAGGDFTITDAEQDMSEADWEQGTGTVYLKFRVNDEPFEYKLKLMSDWLDTDIIKDINDALETAGVEKRVYAMDDNGQGCILFCRDKAWAKEFKKITGIRLQTR